MDIQSLWTLATETLRAIEPFYREAMAGAIQESGAPTNWILLRLACACDPQPITVERLQAGNSYGSPKRFAERLEQLAQAELLERVGEDAYRLTDQGRAAVKSIFDAAQAKIAPLDLLPAADMAQLNGLLYRVVEAMLAAPEPADKWSLRSSRWTDPGPDAPPFVKLDQYLTDLSSYRDDAHPAAWQPYGASGQAWEALTFIWRDQADTPEKLAELLPFRQYTAADYEAALRDLAARGWVVEESGRYKLTNQGRRIREEAEATTDRYFFAGWNALSEAELAQVHVLLTRAHEALQKEVLRQLLTLRGEASQAIYTATRDFMSPLFPQYGLDKPGFFAALLTARGVEPEPLSAAYLSAYAPYINSAQFGKFLTAAAEAGMLAPQGEGYVMTEKGRAAIQAVEHAFYTYLGGLTLPESIDVAQAEALLDRLVQACLNAAAPADKSRVSTSYRGHLPGEYAPLAKIDQHLDDLSAFRDDAHIAAWRPYGVDGRAWEAFTFVWRGDATTAEALAEKLPFHSYTAEEYAGALADLTARGWIERAPDGYRATDEGRTLRQEAEDATDRYYFAPWAALSDGERIQLHWLLTQLRNALGQPAAA